MRLPLLSAGLVTAALLLSGCTGADDAPEEPAAGVSPTPTPTPTAPTSSAGPSSTPSPSASESATPADRLLTTAEVPGLNESWVWQDGRTGPATATPFTPCDRGSLSDIGAAEVLERSYFPPDDSDDNAAHQIATFPDEKTARTAWSVLEAWHDRCGAADRSLRVRELRPVAVATGEARWYLVSTRGTAETARFDTVGMVRAGTTIAVLRMTHGGQDHTYPPGEDPMIAMVRAAADRLG